jgi:hypothetical protein
VHEPEIGRDNVADTELHQITGHQGLGLDGVGVASADDLTRGCREGIERLDGLLGAVVLEEPARGETAVKRTGVQRSTTHPTTMLSEMTAAMTPPSMWSLMAKERTIVMTRTWAS